MDGRNIQTFGPTSTRFDDLNWSICNLKSSSIQSSSSIQQHPARSLQRPPPVVRRGFRLGSQVSTWAMLLSILSHTRTGSDLHHPSRSTTAREHRSLLSVLRWRRLADPGGPKNPGPVPQQIGFGEGARTPAFRWRGSDPCHGRARMDS